jgi:hypothetical protein
LSRFPRNTALLLLLVLILLSVAVRYPLVEHERYQTDSYYIHYLSKTIADDGYAKWTFHSLSYIGYYPFSYPAGVPFLISELSSATGVNIELSILVADMMLAVIFCLAVFVLARQFIRKSEYVLLAAFFSILGARFVDTSYWDASARSLLVVLIVFVTFTSFRAASVGQRRMLGFAILFIAGCFAVHHMAVLLVLFGLGYLLASFQANWMYARARTHKRRAVVISDIAVAILVSVIAFGYFEFSKKWISILGETSLFAFKPVALSIALNTAMSYTNQIGFILIPAILCLPGLFRRARLSVESLFLVSPILVFIPLLASTLYVSIVLSPFVSILGTIYISNRLDSAKKKKFVVLLLALLMASSIFLPIWSSERWNERAYLSGDTVEVDPRVFSDGMYLKYNYGEVYAISNVNTLQQLIATASDVNFLSSGIPSVIAGDIKSIDIRMNVSWSSAEFPTNVYVWFQYKGESSVDFYVQMLVVYGLAYAVGQGNSTATGVYFSSHSRMVVVIDNDRPFEFVGVYATLNASFLPQLNSASWRPPHSGDNPSFDSYMTYSSGRTTYYIVDLPF